MQHPYLYFSAADEARFREKIRTDPAARARYESAVSDAEKAMREPFVTEEEANGPDTLHANFGLLNQQLRRLNRILGLKHRIEGDPAPALRLRDLLLHFISFERWYAVSYAVRKPIPWHSDLCSTGTTLAAATAYDLIYDVLTPAERDAIAKGIFERGVLPAFSDWVLPETRIHAVDSMGHNWWAVCIGEAAAALLALRDRLPGENAERMLALADRALADYLAYPGNPLFNKMRNFDDRGMFYESVAYDNYGTGSLLRYLYVSERYAGRNETIRAALPAGLLDGLMEFSYPVFRDGEIRYDFLNFGDSDVREDVSLVTQYASMLGLGTAASDACASTCGTGLFEEIAGIDFSSCQGSPEALPKTAVLSSGFALTRDSWKPDGTLFAVKSGFCWNHSHNDAGSFLLWHKGSPFFVDEGTCSYESPFYHAYYCQDAAHSVLRLVRGGGRRDEELYRGTKFPGRISGNYAGRDFVWFQADAAGPMAHLVSRLYRNFLWFENRMLLIVDDVFCHAPDRVEFTLHFDGTYRASGNGAEFANGESRARFLSHFPETTLSERVAHPDHGENLDKPSLVFTTRDEERTHLLIHTLELDPEEHPASFVRLTGENAEGLRITRGGIEREIWFNRQADGHVMHDNSNNVIAGFDTDAYLLLITRDLREKTERVFAVSASFLRRGGRTYATGFTKRDFEIVTSL